MKRCPSCNRTYSDETISFCLADGELLSPPYEALRAEPPQTEIIPAASRSAVPPTQPSGTVVPTITSLPAHRNFAGADDHSAQSTKRSRPLVWIPYLLAGLAIIAGIVLALRYFNRSVAVSTSQETLSETKDLPSPGISPTMGQTSTPATSSTNDNRIFSESEVTTKARILEKPEASYTPTAKENQVTGTVVLRAVFSSDGTVTNIRVVSGLADGLSEQAIVAAKMIKFVPAMKDDRPVSMSIELQYNFNHQK